MPSYPQNPPHDEEEEEMSPATEGSEGGGSYSSRISTKSDKNMADFDGEEEEDEEEEEEEDSPPEEEDVEMDDDLLQSLSPAQIADLAARNGSGTSLKLSLSSGGSVTRSKRGVSSLTPPTTTTLLLPPRAMRMFWRRKRFAAAGGGGYNFQIENVTSPGATLLWDLIQDDKIVSGENTLGK